MGPDSTVTTGVRASPELRMGTALHAADMAKCPRRVERTQHLDIPVDDLAAAVRWAVEQPSSPESNLQTTSVSFSTLTVTPFCLFEAPSVFLS